MNVSYTSQVTGDVSGNTVREKGTSMTGLDGAGLDDHVHGDGGHRSLGCWSTDQHGGGARSTRHETRTPRTTEPRTTTELTPQVDLQITKTDGVTSAIRVDAVDIHDRGDQRRPERGTGGLGHRRIAGRTDER